MIFIFESSHNSNTPTNINTHHAKAPVKPNDTQRCDVKKFNSDIYSNIYDGTRRVYLNCKAIYLYERIYLNYVIFYIFK